MHKEYKYDSVGRLVKAASGDTDEGTTWTSWDNLTEYTYDRVGNRTSMDDGTDVYGYAYTQFIKRLRTFNSVRIICIDNAFILILLRVIHIHFRA